MHIRYFLLFNQAFSVHFRDIVKYLNKSLNWMINLHTWNWRLLDYLNVVLYSSSTVNSSNFIIDDVSKHYLFCHLFGVFVIEANSNSNSKFWLWSRTFDVNCIPAHVTAIRIKCIYFYTSNINRVWAESAVTQGNYQA